MNLVKVYTVTIVRIKVVFFLHYLELGTTKPSSTQQILVFSSPTSTTQAALKPQPKTEDTDSWHMKMGKINKFIFHFRGK